MSFTLKEGERVCLAGANGSGKTTLALLLAGILKPTEGRIYVNDQLVEKIPPRLAALGFQNPDDQMVASVVEKEIAFGLELQNCSMPEMETELSSVAERFGIGPLRRREIATLSGGEKQKVAIASLTVTHPKLLILDEPDSFLDQSGKAALAQALHSLRASNPQLAEIRVTQEMQTMTKAERLIVMGDGKIVGDGKSSELLNSQKIMTEGGLNALTSSEVAAGKHRWGGEKDDSAVVETISLCFSYGSKTLIENLSFRWRAGEIVGVVGATGSGKSTLALLLCGLLAPTSGEIRSDFVNATGSGQMVTLAVQQPERQFFLPTCAEEIAFGPRNLGRHLSADDTDIYLSASGLDPELFRNRDPLTLSVGEQRRLAFAVLEALECPFMIFDEPTAGLDARGIAEFEAMAHRLTGSGKGIMVISHDHALIERLAGKTIEM